ncbi:MAG: hypothetical protein K8S56_10800 [Candidatus Cloacimonetes bacterium]|nr:hypothetical protein [Candidatus Cloacimonadota bacterium]
MKIIAIAVLLIALAMVLVTCSTIIPCVHLLNEDEAAHGLAALQALDTGKENVVVAPHLSLTTRSVSEGWQDTDIDIQIALWLPTEITIKEQVFRKLTARGIDVHSVNPFSKQDRVAATRWLRQQMGVPLHTPPVELFPDYCLNIAATEKYSVNFRDNGTVYKGLFNNQLCPMIRFNKQQLLWQETTYFEAVLLQVSKEQSLCLILPKSGYSPDIFVQNLNPDILQHWLEQFTLRKLVIDLPAWETSGISLFNLQDTGLTEELTDKDLQPGKGVYGYSLSFQADTSSGGKESTLCDIAFSHPFLFVLMEKGHLEMLGVCRKI